MRPTQYWPWPPMLNIPQRNANATASAVRISGVVMMSVCWRSSAALKRSSPCDPGEEPVEAGAREDRLVGGEGVVPGRDDDETADEEREDGRRERREEPAESRVPAADDLVAGAGVRALAHAAVAFRFPPTMAKPISSSETSGLYSRDDLALVDDEDPVGERQDLVELEGDEQDGAALVPLLDEAAVDELDRADVEAAGRLRRDEDARVARDLARDDHLLLVAARERRGRRLGPPPRTSNSFSSASRARDQPPREEPAVLRVRLLAVVVQRDVLRQAEVEDEAAQLAVLGDVPDARVEALARRARA